MKTFSCLLLGLAIQSVAWAEEKPQIFYAQLIRGTDDSKPAETSWKPVGPKLSRQFAPKFRWKSYWEVQRSLLNVPARQVARVSLGPEREVEVDLSRAGAPEVRLYTKGVLVRKCRESLKTGMCIMGGTRENDESWFVVVRCDAPTNQ